MTKRNGIKIFYLIVMICGAQESFGFEGIKNFVATHPKIMGGVLLVAGIGLDCATGDKLQYIDFIINKNAVYGKKPTIAAGLSALIVGAALFNHFCPGNMSFLGSHGGKLSYTAWIAGITYLFPYGIMLAGNKLLNYTKKQ